MFQLYEQSGRRKGEADNSKNMAADIEKRYRQQERREERGEEKER